MDELTAERRKLAVLLSDALHKLECITGVFLIKPVVTYKGKNRPKRYVHVLFVLVLLKDLLNNT